MEYSGAVYGVLLNDPDLRHQLVREAHSPRLSARAVASGQALRVSWAATLRMLANRVDPTSCVVDPRTAGAV